MRQVLVHKSQPGRLAADVAGATMLALAIAALYLTGIAGLGRSSDFFADFRFFYAAGLVWWDGGTPYDPDVYWPVLRELPPADYDRKTFAYPPMFAPFAMAFAALPFEIARRAWLALNLASLAVLAFFIIRLVTNAEQPRPASDMQITPWLLAALVVGNPFTWRLFWVGQVTLLYAALLVGAWYFARRQREVTGGVLLGLASAKPQMIFLPALWLLLDRKWKAVATAVAVAVLLAAYPLLLDGLVPTVEAWRQAMENYQTEPINRLGNRAVVGLPSAMAALGSFEISVFWGLLAAIGTTLMLWSIRSRLCPDDILGILLAIQFVFVYVHVADLVLLAPLGAALWLHVAHRPWTWWATGLILLILYIPDRVMVMSEIPVLTQWLTFTIIAVLAVLTYFSLNEGAGAKPGPGGDARPPGGGDRAIDSLGNAGPEPIGDNADCAPTEGRRPSA